MRNNGQIRTLARLKREDGSIRTSYVYGCTAREVAEAWIGLTRETLLHVEEVKDYVPQPRALRGLWDDGRPKRYFFNEHLGREPIRGGAGADAVAPRDGGRGPEGVGAGETDQGGLGPDDGDAR